MIGSRDMKAADLLPTPSEWERLSVVPEKRDAFAKDLYFRECWADVAGIFGNARMSMLGSIGILNVKPDAVVGRRMTGVLEFVIEHDFLPIAAAPLRLTRHSIRELWRYDWHVYPVDRLAFSTFWYTSTEVLMFVLQDISPQGFLPASVRLSQLKGHGLPEKRTSSDLRTVLRSPNGILTFVHVADEPLDVVRELGIFFDRPERKALLTEIKHSAGVNRYDDVLNNIARLEACYPEHDLNFSSSLSRLEKSLAVTAKAATYLRKLLSDGETLGWDDLCSMIDPATEEVDRWDFISVASHVIRLERDVSPDIFPSVDVDRWAMLASEPAAFGPARFPRS